MQRIIFAILFISSIRSFGQEGHTQQVLTQIIEHAEEVSLYKDQVKWDTLKVTMHTMAKDAQSISDLSPALKHMLKSLGDEHGRIFHNNKPIAYYYKNDLQEHLIGFDSNIYNDIQMGQVYPFHAELLDNNIGYIRIVGLPMGDNTKMAAEIQSEVCRLIELGAQKWIVDLRYNGGGNMHPMAEGISAIIGDGLVGGAEGLTEFSNSKWIIKDGDFYYDDYSVQLKNDCSQRKWPKVAVLTSMYTASSGEAIAVLFKGREATKFFGQKTLGMITVTNWHPIDENTNVSISVSYYADRLNHVYTKYVDVDKACAFERNPLSMQDSCLLEAAAWLKE